MPSKLQRILLCCYTCTLRTFFVLFRFLANFIFSSSQILSVARIVSTNVRRKRCLEKYTFFDLLLSSRRFLGNNFDVPKKRATETMNCQSHDNVGASFSVICSGIVICNGNRTDFLCLIMASRYIMFCHLNGTFKMHETKRGRKKNESREREKFMSTTKRRKILIANVFRKEKRTNDNVKCVKCGVFVSLKRKSCPRSSSAETEIKCLTLDKAIFRFFS